MQMVSFYYSQNLNNLRAVYGWLTATHFMLTYMCSRDATLYYLQLFGLIKKEDIFI